MADDFEVKFEGINDFKAKLEEVRARYPFKEEEILLKLGGMLKASAKDKTPLGGDKKHLRDQYKLSKVNYEKDGSNITMTNKSPLFHLIENGHQQVVGGKLAKGGKVVKFVPGKHMVETAMIELDQVLPTVVDAWLDGILGGAK